MNLLRAIVTLDTGERPEYIHIYEGDDIELLAEFFCIRHEIMEDGKQFIINEIQKQLNNQEKLKQQTQSTKNKTLKQCQSQAIFFDKQKVCNKLNSNIEKNEYQALHKNIWTTIEKKPSTTQLHNRNGSNISMISKKQSKGQDNKKNTPRLQKCYTNVEEVKVIQQPRRTLQEQINHASKLMNLKSASEQRLQQLRLDSKSPKNQNFKPQINKNNIFKKVSDRVDKEDYEIARMIGINMNKKFYDSTQPRIQKQQDQEILRKIFNQLDNDQDGIISSQFINYHINHTNLEKIQPVLEYMEEQHLILDFGAFSNLMRSFNILIY